MHHPNAAPPLDYHEFKASIVLEFLLVSHIIKLEKGLLFSFVTVRKYSAGQKKRYDCCFMKQKCQLQMGVSKYKNAAMPLRSKGNDTTHQQFQMMYITRYV